MTNRKALPVPSFVSGICFSYHSSQKKMRVRELSPSDGNGSSTNEDEPLPQDADYINVLSLSDELETSILARLPRI